MSVLQRYIRLRVFFSGLPVVVGGEHEYRLTKYLLGNYEPSVRPAENASAPVNVTFDMSIHHIIDVDEKNQVLTMNCWLTQV